MVSQRQGNISLREIDASQVFDTLVDGLRPGGLLTESGASLEEFGGLVIVAEPSVGVAQSVECGDDARTVVDLLIDGQGLLVVLQGRRKISQSAQSDTNTAEHLGL